jgi:L-amino acid N-acyltransferase
MGVVVRDATEADLPAILEIYNEAIANSTATFDEEPKTLEERRQWFRETRYPHGTIVAERGGEVAAWGSLRPFRPKAAYRFTAEDSVYVHEAHRGVGVGRMVLARLLEMAEERGFHAVMAGIAEGNPASERVHASLGFWLAGVEREVGYKFGRWLDVAWWEWGPEPRPARSPLQ